MAAYGKINFFLPFSLREEARSWAEELIKFASRYLEIELFEKCRWESLLHYLWESSMPVLLDMKGNSFFTLEFAQWLKRKLQEKKQIDIFIGDAGGFSKDFLKQAALKGVFVWSLSSLTLQHEMAFLVALEQIWRAVSIWIGHPYHR